MRSASTGVCLDHQIGLNADPATPLRVQILQLLQNSRGQRAQVGRLAFTLALDTRDRLSMSSISWLSCGRRRGAPVADNLPA